MGVNQLSPPRGDHQHLLVLCQGDLVDGDGLGLEDAGEEFLLQVLADHVQAVLEIGAVVGNVGEIRHRDVDGAVGRKCNHDGIGLVADRGGLDVEQLAHQGHTLVFMLRQDMGIRVRRKGYRRVAQDHGQSLGVHFLLHRAGGECMPERVEGKMGQACQLQDLIVVIPEGSGLNEAAHGVRNDHAAVAVILSRYGTVIHLHRPPCLQVLDHLGQQRHRPGGVLGLGRLHHDLRGLLVGILGAVHFVQAAQRTPDMQQPSRHIHVLPPKAQQLAKPNSSKEGQSYKYAVAMVIAGQDQLVLLISGQDGDRGLGAPGQVDAGRRIGIDQSLIDCEIQGTMQEEIDIDNRLGGQALRRLLVIVVHLQHSRRQLLQLDVSQHRPQMVADVGFIGQIGRLLDTGTEINLQAQGQPLAQGAFFKGSRFGIIEKCHLVEETHGLLLCLCILGDTMGLTGDDVVRHRDPNFKPAIGSLTDCSFVVRSGFCH